LPQGGEDLFGHAGLLDGARHGPGALWVSRRRERRTTRR
jgi:hypothetical protein